MSNLRNVCLGLVAVTASLAAPSRAQFLEDFESCPVGNITNNGAPGCNGWQQWDGAANATSLVNNTLAYTGSHSVSIDAILGGQTSDLVHTFTGYNAGHVTVRAFQYLPGPGAAPPLVPAFDKIWFIVLNTYQNFGPYNWSVQLVMDPAAGTWSIDAGSPATATGPLVFDRWVSVRAEIDLGTDRCEVFYDGTPCAPPYSWTGGVFGAGGGVLDVAALDLYHSPATVSTSGKAYWDDVRVRQSGTPEPVAYCNSKRTSNGCTPLIGHSGLSDATAASGFVIKGTGFVNNKSCLLFYSLAGPATTPFQNGLLCVKAPIRRTIVTSTGGNPPPNDCSGAPAIDMNAFAAGALGGSPDPGLKIPGNVVHCQWWGRDPGFAAPNNTQLSNALAYTVGPVAASGSMFRDMVFNNVSVRLSNSAAFNHGALLNGTITVSSAGQPNGSVHVAFTDGSTANIMMTPSGGTFIQTGGSLLDLLTTSYGSASVDQALLNGSPVSIAALATQLKNDVNAGLSPLFMSDGSRALLAMSTLGYTSQWNLNGAIALQLGNALFGMAGFWCKAAIVVAVAVIVGLGAAICLTICAAGGAITAGLFTVPCGLICVGGALVAIVVLEAILAGMWNP